MFHVKHFLFSVFILTSLSSYSQLNNVVLEAKAIPKPAVIDTTVTSWDTNQKPYSKLGKQAKEFLYWTNYSRANPKRFWDSIVVPILETFPSLKSSYSESLQRDLYAAHPLPLFKLNNNLVFTAQSHASDIGLKKGTPGHISSDGRTFSTRIRAVGIKDCGGENVSLGDVDPVLSLVLLYIDYGIPELGHRKALLNPDYVETGVGVSPYGDAGSIFIVEDFSCAQ